MSKNGIITSAYPILRTEDDIIWDLSNFDKSPVRELLTNNDMIEPKKIDDKCISICKCDFNVKSLIHEKATTDDVISSWTMVSKELKLDRLVKVSIRDSLYNLYLTKLLLEEPDIVLLLRLAYWYNRCRLIDSDNTFEFKKNEIKEKLTCGLLNEIEKINRKFDTVNLISLNALAQEWEQIHLTLINNEPSNRQQLQSESKLYRDRWFIDVWNVTSELLFAAFCEENGFKVTFQTKPKKEGHDYDFIVDGYPAQVKSLNVSYEFSEAYNSKKNRLQNVQNDTLTTDFVKNKIIDSISSKYKLINNALSQGPKIIFLNATSAESGIYFSQYCFDTTKPFAIKDSLNTSINLIKNNNEFVPLIFSATGFRSGYYIYTLASKIPIIIVNNERKVDRDNQIELLQDINTPYI